jgi:outer membrane protein TolC
MLIKDIELAQADAYRLDRASGLWPAAYADLRYLNNVVATTNSATNKGDGFFYDLEFNQPVYHWGALKAAADIGGLQRKIAQKQFAEAYRQLVGLLRQQFLGLIRQKKALQCQSYNLEIAERGFAMDEEKYAKGALAPAVIATARLVIEEQRLAVARTRSEWQGAKRFFMRLAGLRELSDERIPDTLSRPGWMDDQATRLVAEFQQAEGALMTPQAEVYTYLIRQRDLDYRIAKVRLLPKFSFYASITLQNLTNATKDTLSQRDVVSQTATSNQTFGMRAYWSIFDGFATRSAKLGALAGKRLGALQLQTYLDGLGEEIRSLTEQSNLAARAVALSEQRLQMAAGSLSHAEEEARQGRISPASLALARAGWYADELTALDSRIALYNQWSRLVGVLWVDPMLQNLPATYLNHGQ